MRRRDKDTENRPLSPFMNGGIMFDYTANGTVIEADKCNSDTPQAFDCVNLRSKWEYHNGCVH